MEEMGGGEGSGTWIVVYHEKRLFSKTINNNSNKEKQESVCYFKSASSDTHCKVLHRKWYRVWPQKFMILRLVFMEAGFMWQWIPKPDYPKENQTATNNCCQACTFDHLENSAFLVAESIWIVCGQLWLHCHMLWFLVNILLVPGVLY